MIETKRISFDNEDNQLYQELRGTELFYGLSLLDLFAIALILGKKFNKRTQMGPGAVGRIHESIISNSDVKFLMMALAVDETGSLDILGNGSKYIEICEEYAKTGISLLVDDYSNRGYDLLDDMEHELLEYFDKYVE